MAPLSDGKHRGLSFTIAGKEKPLKWPSSRKVGQIRHTVVVQVRPSITTLQWVRRTKANPFEKTIIGSDGMLSCHLAAFWTLFLSSCPAQARRLLWFGSAVLHSSAPEIRSRHSDIYLLLYGAGAFKEANEVLHKKETCATLTLWLERRNPSLLQRAAPLDRGHMDSGYTRLAGHFRPHSTEHCRHLAESLLTH